MLTDYEASLLARSVDGWSRTGDPVRQVANVRPAVLPQQLVRVIASGWYGPGARPVEVGQQFKLPLDEAHGARALKRVEFV